MSFVQNYIPSLGRNRRDNLLPWVYLIIIIIEPKLVAGRMIVSQIKMNSLEGLEVLGGFALIRSGIQVMEF